MSESHAKPAVEEKQSQNPTTTVHEASARTESSEKKPTRSSTQSGARLGTRTPLASNVKSTIGENSRERRVPGSRLGRMASFGSLGFGLGVGALAEVTRRGLGLNKVSGKGQMHSAS